MLLCHEGLLLAGVCASPPSIVQCRLCIAVLTYTYKFSATSLSFKFLNGGIFETAVFNPWKRSLKKKRKKKLNRKYQSALHIVRISANKCNFKAHVSVSCMASKKKQVPMRNNNVSRATSLQYLSFSNV